MYRCIALSLGFLLTGSLRLQAQGEPLDLIPANAAAALVFHDPDGLKTRGDKLFAEAGINTPGLRPSQLVALALQFLGVNGGFDGKGSTAAIVLAPDNKPLPGTEELVIALPFTDLDQMAGNFGLKKGELKPGKVTPVQRGRPFGLLLAQGKHVFLGDKKRALIAAAGAKSIRNELSAAQLKSLRGSDILIHFGTKAWESVWRIELKRIREQFGKREEPAEQKIVDQFFDALGAMRFGIGGVRVDGGVGVSFMAVFARDGPARHFLAPLAAGKGGSDLSGLPDGKVVFAQALRGSAAGNDVVAKVLFDTLLYHFVETRDLLSALDRPLIVGFLTEVMNRLEGSRAALYLTSDESRLGLFSLAAILDTDDASRFLGAMKLLARIADGSGLDLKPNSTSPDRIDIKQLIRNLGDVKFRARESATLKLRLLGEAALPYLQKARAATDLEVSRRAGRLSAQILKAAALRRKGLLEQNWLGRLQPSFALIPHAEKRGRHEIDVIRVRLAQKDKTVAKPLQQIFGPEWHNVRLAVHGNKVVVFLGSDLAILEAALTNLTESRPGLATTKALRSFRAISNPERRLDLHLSMSTIVKLIDATRAGDTLPGIGGSPLSSLAISLEPDRMQLDVWIPAAEFKVLGKRIGF